MSSDLILFRHPDCLRHEAPGPHPENPERLISVYSLFVEDPGLASLPVMAARPAAAVELSRVHAEAMLARLLGAKGKSGWLDGDTYHNPSSVEAALLAAGGGIDLALAVHRGEYRRGFSLVRPPGHHATRESSMGFCLVNNIALAAEAVRAEAPGIRLAIVDFDLHHGNGTQWSYYDDPDVLFVSSHRYPFYPGTGAHDEIGKGKGKGTTLNFPLAKRYDGRFFTTLYQELVCRPLAEFAPDLILVSAGFDGHERDPMEGFRIDTATYATLARLLVDTAEKRNGKILFFLEGGYDPLALKESVRAVLNVLSEQPRRAMDTTTPTSEYPEIDAFRAYFKALFPTL